MTAKWAPFAIILAIGGCEDERSASQAVRFEMADAQPAPELPEGMAEPSWRPCPNDGDSWFGNRWYGEFSLCAGDLRVVLRADGVDLGGPGLGAWATTQTCFYGQTAAVGGNVPKSYFWAIEADQVNQAKDLVRMTVSEIGPECGGPFESNLLFDEDFGMQFSQFADYYWRYLEERELSEALSAQRDIE
jgi:hypothetical protein